MDVLCLDDNIEGTEVKSSYEFPASVSSDMDSKFEDPEVLPRVGHQYQAEIPSLILSPDLSLLIKKLGDSEVMVNLPNPFLLGLPIPLMWAYCEVLSRYGSLGSVNSEERPVISKDQCPKVNVEPLTTLLGEGTKVEGFPNFHASFKWDKTGMDSHPRLQVELDQARGMYLLPGSLGESWTDIEYNSFLLGLYAFGKNLNFVRRFVGSKNMGDVLSFYYGRFYRSEGYHRWSACRKLRIRRCIYGQKIFTGWRQQELLSRLFSHVSGECQNLLVELSRNFGEGKMPFEEYVFALKDAVGIDMLIDAVGIGKGKQDLTGTAVEPTRTNHIFSGHREIPIGKACSSLTSAEIIKFLTGNFRLSKARSGDLFWEAVWPRLLAKGWHSEQPKNHAVSCSKQSLVFLIPGVKKFSRRRLVKGNHYFDSVSDVLNKVASNPGLLEIEIQATEGSVDTENRQDKDNLDCLLNKQQYRYLQPLSSNCNQDLLRFTIVDTSMVYDLEQHKVREVRSLPFQCMSISTLSSHSSGSEQGTYEESEDQDEQTYSSNPVEDFSDKGVSTDSSDGTHIPEALIVTKVAVENHKHHSDMHNDEQSKDTEKYQFIQKTSDCSLYSPPIMKKQKITACNHEVFTHCTECTSIDRNINLNESTSTSNRGDASEGFILSGFSQNMSSSSSIAKGSSDESNEVSVSEKYPDGEASAEKPQTRTLIDLNLPHVLPELGTEMEVPSSMVMLQNYDNQCSNTSSSLAEISQLNEIQEFPDGLKEQQPIIVNRRQSTRNRPLTTKALEALEYRFLNSKRKRKNMESSHTNSKSQCLRVSGGTMNSAIHDYGTGNVMAETGDEEKNVIWSYSSSIDLNSEAHYNL